MVASKSSTSIIRIQDDEVGLDETEHNKNVTQMVV